MDTREEFLNGMASVQSSRSGVAFTLKDFPPFGSNLPASHGSSSSTSQKADASSSCALDPSLSAFAPSSGSSKTHAASHPTASDVEMRLARALFSTLDLRLSSLVNSLSWRTVKILSLSLNQFIIWELLLGRTV